jgi:hypothetical protein
MTPIERRDLIDQKLSQAVGICSLIADACEDNGAVHNSAWAASTLVHEVIDLRKQAYAERGEDA